MQFDPNSHLNHIEIDANRIRQAANDDPLRFFDLTERVRNNDIKDKENNTRKYGNVGLIISGIICAFISISGAAIFRHFDPKNIDNARPFESVYITELQELRLQNRELQKMVKDMQQTITITHKYIGDIRNKVSHLHQDKFPHMYTKKGGQLRFHYDRK